MDLTFGPPALIGRFILHADRAARERGVYLSLEHDFDALIAFNKTQANSWFPMIPTFDPEFGDLTPENAFWISGRDRDGEIVVCQCARFFDWRDTNFKQEFESLRLIYQDPDIERLPEECAFSEALSGHHVSGLVCFSGGAWYHPDYRGRGLRILGTGVGRKGRRRAVRLHPGRTRGRLAQLVSWPHPGLLPSLDGSKRAAQ